jgi:RsiW-degrading membrane proteinase PrsW (M82 family)
MLPASAVRPAKVGRLVMLATGLIVIGAVVLAVFIVLQGGPKAAGIAVALAALPVGPLIACYLWLDRYEPEPLRYLMIGLGWGAVVATACSAAGELLVAAYTSLGDLAQASVAAPLIEEFAKALFIAIVVIARRRQIDGVLDGIVYAGMVGIGFAFTENILYFMAAYLGSFDLGLPDGSAAPSGSVLVSVLFFLRALMSPFAHPLFTAATGVGLGVAVTTRRAWLRVVAPLLGFATAVAMHGAFNFTAYKAGDYFFLVYLVAMVPVFIGAVVFAVWVRHREGRTLTKELAECARLGWFHPAEIPWLTNLSRRRAARRYAQRHRGEFGKRAVKEYQQASTELAFLRNRMSHGNAPANAEQRHQEIWSRLMGWRPYVLLPPVPMTYPPRPPMPPGAPAPWAPPAQVRGDSPGPSPKGPSPPGPPPGTGNVPP